MKFEAKNHNPYSKINKTKTYSINFGQTHID